jgi:hypothetical protein
MRKLEVRLTRPGEERVVGQLVEDARRLYFEYDPAFLREPLWLSPFKLPQRARNRWILRVRHPLLIWLIQQASLVMRAPVRSRSRNRPMAPKLKKSRWNRPHDWINIPAI